MVQDAGDASDEIAAIDLVASMPVINNPQLKAAAQDVRQELKNVVAALKGVARQWRKCARAARLSVIVLVALPAFRERNFDFDTGLT